jgi:hypothetical protein
MKSLYCSKHDTYYYTKTKAWCHKDKKCDKPICLACATRPEKHECKVDENGDCIAEDVFI